MDIDNFAVAVSQLNLGEHLIVKKRFSWNS